MNARHVLFGVVSVICAATNGFGQSQDNVRRTFFEKMKSVSEARSILPSLAFACEAEVTLKGFWNGEGTASCKQSSTFEGDFAPGGRFKVLLNPVCIPWTNGDGNLYAEQKVAAYDGRKLSVLVKGMGPYGRIAKTNRAIPDADISRDLAPLEQVFALQAFIGMASFRSFGGIWADITNWSQIPRDRLKIEQTSPDAFKLSILETKSAETPVPVEELEIQTHPKPAVKSYKSVSRDNAGNIVSEYSVEVVQLEANLPLPIALPKKVMTRSLSLKTPLKRDQGERVERIASLQFSYAPVKSAPPEYHLEIPAGFEVIQDGR